MSRIPTHTSGPRLPGPVPTGVDRRDRDAPPRHRAVRDSTHGRQPHARATEVSRLRRWRHAARVSLLREPALLRAVPHLWRADGERSSEVEARAAGSALTELSGPSLATGLGGVMVVAEPLEVGVGVVVTGLDVVTLGAGHRAAATVGETGFASAAGSASDAHADPWPVGWEPAAPGRPCPRLVVHGARPPVGAALCGARSCGAGRHQHPRTQNGPPLGRTASNVRIA